VTGCAISDQHKIVVDHMMLCWWWWWWWAAAVVCNDNIQIVALNGDVAHGRL
jgi:hypothetical protein